MNCPNCGIEINIQKNTYKKCKCGATLMCVKIGNKLVVDDVSKDRSGTHGRS